MLDGVICVVLGDLLDEKSCIKLGETWVTGVNKFDLCLEWLLVFGKNLIDICLDS